MRLKMKNIKGITVTSLAIYVVVATIIVGILAFLNAQFFSNINELTAESNTASEGLNFKTAFIKDLKSSVEVVSFSSNKITLSSGISYEIRKLDSENVTDDRYAVYRNDVKIADNILEYSINVNNVKQFFSYDANRRVILTSWQYTNGKTSSIESGTYSVGLIGDGESFANFSGGSINTTEVFYHSNDEQNLTKTQYVIMGNSTAIILPGLFTRSGYILRGYSTTPTGTIEYQEGDDFSTSIKDLYAVWQKASGYANITFYASEGRFNRYATATSYNNVKYMLMDDNGAINASIVSGFYLRPSNLPKYFKGWSTKPDGTGIIYKAEENIISILTDGLKLYAVYENTLAYYADGVTFNVKIKQIAGNSSATIDSDDNVIKGFRWSRTEPPNDYKTSDHIVSAATSSAPIYAWIDSNIIYLWSEATNILLSPSCYGMFKGLTRLKTLSMPSDMNIISTNKTSNMAYMFCNCRSLTYVNIEPIDTVNTIEANNMFENCEVLDNLDVSLFDTAEMTRMDYMFSGMKRLKKLDVTHFDTSSVTNMSHMFYNCGALNDVDVSNFNVRRVKDFSWMFYTVPVSTLDISGWRTDSVENLEGCFADMANVAELDFSGFTTEECVGMRSFLRGCSSLISADLSTFSTKNVVVGHNGAEIYPMEMFSGCINLTKVSFGENCTFEKSESMSNMFANCKKLKTIEGLEYFNTERVRKFDAMFYECNLVEAIDVSKFDSGRANTLEKMFYNCDTITELDLSNFKTNDVTSMAGEFYSCDLLKTIYASYDYIVSSGCDVSNMFSGCYNLVGGRGTTYRWLSDYRPYAHIDEGVSNPGFFTLIREPVTITYYANFGYDVTETESFGADEDVVLALCTWTRNGHRFAGWSDENEGDAKYQPGDVLSDRTITKIYAIWERISATSRYLPQYANNSNVQGTFKYVVNKLSNGYANVTRFVWSDTEPSDDHKTQDNIISTAYPDSQYPIYAWFEKNTNNNKGVIKLWSISDSVKLSSQCSNMFSHFTGLTSFNLYEDMRITEADYVVTCESMFKDCSNLVSVNLDGFIPSNATNLQQFFASCKKLKNVSIPDLRAPHCTNYYSFFYQCFELESVDLRAFNTSSTTRFEHMFRQCKKLKTIDISMFDTSNAKDIQYMFAECPLLETIYVSENFVTTSVTSGNNTFLNSPSLVGGNGTRQSVAGVTNYTYARIDTDDYPGYFTLKEESNGG